MCGHIVAHVLGGKSDIDNLMPICRACNRDTLAYKNQVNLILLFWSDSH